MNTNVDMTAATTKLEPALRYLAYHGGGEQREAFPAIAGAPVEKVGAK